eukprot:CAMPEP_0167762012 /NCGR_PEP_ID=MMETSP0110_2-20121227/12506_1 /TAXON_ID=629695 /ORGANISM="Gymnochlora sp., Strain CCMP2014" /LENGTH=69 /DNA_ID=CAMNT_0007648789 /DNA_START=15 /DNA_END=224 /DNA_ORIENTATION=-
MASESSVETELSSMKQVLQKFNSQNAVLSKLVDKLKDMERTMSQSEQVVEKWLMLMRTKENVVDNICRQ